MQQAQLERNSAGRLNGIKSRVISPEDRGIFTNGAIQGFAAHSSQMKRGDVAGYVAYN